MNKMHWIGWAAALSVALAPMTALAVCSNTQPIIFGDTGTIRCKSGSDEGQGSLKIVGNSAVASVFLKSGVIRASITGLDQFAAPVCSVEDRAPADAFAVTTTLNCGGAVMARLRVN